MFASVFRDKLNPFSKTQIHLIRKTFTYYCCF